MEEHLSTYLFLAIFAVAFVFFLSDRKSKRIERVEPTLPDYEPDQVIKELKEQNIHLANRVDGLEKSITYLGAKVDILDQFSGQLMAAQPRRSAVLSAEEVEKVLAEGNPCLDITPRGHEVEPPPPTLKSKQNYEPC